LKGSGRCFHCSAGVRKASEAEVEAKVEVEKSFVVDLSLVSRSVEVKAKVEKMSFVVSSRSGEGGAG
jgi:hypothetical protein